MSEKSAEALLPPMIQGQMVTIPNDVQQLTIKDSTIFIGKDPSYRSTRPCYRRCSIVTAVLIIAVIGFALLSTLYQLRNLVSIRGTVNSGYYVSLNHDMLDSLGDSVENIKRTAASFSDILNQNKLDSGKSESKATILYLSRDPKSSLSNFFQFNSVYIARSYQTTLSFFIQNNQSNTYIDDVSVNNTLGSELISNGGFESGTYRWDGIWSYSSCYITYNTRTNCADSAYASNNIISQTFSTTPGDTLYISFKLRWGGSGAGIFTNITIYP